MNQSRPDQPLIVTAARVHTLASLTGNALLLHGGHVAAVGELDDLRTLAPSAELLAYPDATITPGLTDSHIHITEWAMARRAVDLTDARSPDDAARRTAAHAGRARTGWVLGRGWTGHHWAEPPTRAVLDAAVSDRPVALQSHDMHGLWLNSRALAAAGISAGTPDPEGGRIVRDERGEPTGLLLENAGQLAAAVIPVPSDDDVLAAVLDAQQELHGFGITGIHSLPGFHMIEPQPLRILHRMQEQGSLRLRVLQHLAVDQLDAAIALGLRSGLGGDWLRIGGIKMFLDGTLGSRTAWLRRPYENGADCGVRLMAEADFRDCVRRAAAAGLASTVHAIGDAAVSLAFRVLTEPEAQAKTLPNRIEHVQCCPPDLLPLVGRGVMCFMQPCHLISDWRAADRYWGAARASATYAFRSLLHAGATLAFGSDAPVEPCDPRLGFFAATERQDHQAEPAGGWHPQERLTMAEVLHGYSTGPARAASSTREGNLAPGSYADFVVWDADPLAAAGTALLELKVRATFVDGQPVHHVDEQLAG